MTGFANRFVWSAEDVKVLRRKARPAVDPLACPVCGKRLKTPHALAQHLRDAPHRSVPCSTCGQSFKTAQGLVQHRRAKVETMPYGFNGPVVSGEGALILAEAGSEFDTAEVLRQQFDSRRAAVAWRETHSPRPDPFVPLSDGITDDAPDDDG